jgi:hypothetical protein
LLGDDGADVLKTVGNKQLFAPRKSGPFSTGYPHPYVTLWKSRKTVANKGFLRAENRWE